MICKVAFVAALCVAQGFAFKIRGQGPCKTPDFEFEGKIPREFDEAMHEMDDVTETVSIAALDAYAKGNNSDVIVECFREQKDKYIALGEEMNRKIQEANREIAEMLGDDYQKYAKRIEEPLRAIGVTLVTYPVKVWTLIEKRRFSEALQVFRESKIIIEKNSRNLSIVFKQLAKEYPEAAQRAEELSREIRQEARNGCQAIGEAFRACVEAGGPNKPIQGEVEDAE